MPFDDIRRRGGPERGPGERAINLPPAILWLIVVNVAVQGVRMLIGESADQDIILALGLVPAAYTEEPMGNALSLVAAPFTYQFLHGGWVHLGVNMLSLAAFGAPVERLLGPRRFIAFYLSAGIVAGFVHVVFHLGSPDPVTSPTFSIAPAAKSGMAM